MPDDFRLSMEDDLPGETRREWEIVQHDPQSSTTDRLRIVGGWLYRTRMVGAQGVALVYVPGVTNEGAPPLPPIPE